MSHCRECEKEITEEHATALIVKRDEKYKVHADCLAGIIARTRDPEDKAILEAIYHEHVSR